MQHLLRTFRLLAWLAWLAPVVAWAAPTPATIWVPVRPYPNTQTGIPGLSATGAANGGVTKYTVSTVMSTSQGTLYARGTAITASNTDLTLAQAAALTFVPASGFKGNAFFQYTATDANGTSGAVYYSIPVSSSSCGTLNTSSLDFSAIAQEDWKAHAAAPAGGSTTTSTSAYQTNQATVQETLGGYTVTGNQFATTSTPYLLGQSLVWQLNSATNDPNAATSNTSTVTFTFSRPVNNLSLSVQDIDAGTQANQGSDWVDELQFDGYATTTATTAISLAAGNFGLGTNNTNTFAATNTVRGTATNTTADGTVTLTFPSAVQKLVLTYRNTRAYTSGNRRLQDMGITSMSWCAQNDVQAIFTAVPSNTTVNAGTTVSYTVQFQNNGVDAAANETRVVTLPSGATNVNAGGGTYNAATNTIDFGTIAATSGSNTSFTYSYTVPAAGGTYTNTAAAGSGAGYSSTSPNSSGANAADDSNTNNNVATSNLAVTPVADVVTTLATSATSAAPGTAVTYTATVQNNGPSPAASVAPTVQLSPGLAAGGALTLPANATYNNNTGVVTLPTTTSLATGSGNALTYAITFNQPSYTTTVTGKASSTSTTNDPTTTNNDGSATNANVQTVTTLANNGCGNTAYSNAGSGLYAEYYANYFNDDLTFFTANSPTLTRTDASINFAATNSWGNIVPPAAGNTDNPDRFTARYRGSINIAAAGTYTFYLNSDDASYMWIDAGTANPTTGNALISNGGQHGATTVSKSVTLTAGAHNILIYYGENGGNNVLVLQYAGGPNNIAQQVVPNSILCPNDVVDLATIISGPASAVVGQTVYYQATTTNNNGGTATDVVSTITLANKPAASTLILPSNATYSATTGVVTFTNNSLAGGATVVNSVGFVAQATPATVTGQAASTTSTADAVASNNNGSAANANVSTAVAPTGASGTPAACATAGKDGSLTSTTSVLNTYYPATASAAAGTKQLSVGTARGSSTALAAGDLVLVIQMQGADFDYTDNNNSYGDGVAGGLADGNILNGNFTAGQYEYAQVASISGSTVTLVNNLVNSYVSTAASNTAGQRTFQVVRVPQYANLTLGANVQPSPWNGTTGGIVALDVAGNLNTGTYRIDASGMGFRGGAGRVLGGDNTTTTNTDYRSSASLNAHGTKGEGTAGTPRYVNDASYSTTTNLDTRTATTGYPTLLTATQTDGYPSGDNARGGPGNAGGGGTDASPNSNSQNSGGGGGANGGNGGRGGNSWSSNLPIGGEPGAAFPAASSSRLVLGGGGGAGVTNDGSTSTSATTTSGFTSSGGTGGGIIMVRTGTVSGTGSLLANGTAASSNVGRDGSGGGGAGGSILLTTANGTSGLASLTLSAVGGAGGSNTPGANVIQHGPGGGGGGGVILTNGAVANASSAAAGQNGTTSNNGGAAEAYGAAPGTTGVSDTGISRSVANSVAGATCVTEITASLTGPTTLSAGQPTGTYTATFTNEGPQPATSVTQTVTLPTGASLTATQQQTIRNAYPNATFSTTNNAVTINFGTVNSLAAGSANAFSFAFTAPTATGSSAITANTSTSSNEGANAAPNAAQLALTTTAQADAVAVIAYNATSVAPGATATLTATFSNNGPQTAASATRTVQLPAGLTNVVVKDNNGNTLANAYNSSTGLVTYPTSDQASGTANNYASTITFTAPASGVVPATASINSTTPDGNSTNNVASTSLAVNPQFDLATTISGPTTGVAGSPLTLNVTTTNNGPQASASGAVEAVTLPTGLTNVYVSGGGYYNASTTAVKGDFTASGFVVSTNGGTTISPGQVQFPPFGVLPANQTIANTITFNAPSAAFSPQAQVTVLTGDTQSANNSANLNGAATATAGQITSTTATGTPVNVFAILDLASATLPDGTTYNTGSTVPRILPANTQVTYTVGAGNGGNTSATNNSAANVTQTLQLIPGLNTTTLQVGGQTGTASTTTPNVINFSGITTTDGSGVTYTAKNASYNTVTGVLTLPTATTLAADNSTTTSVAVTLPTTVANNGRLVTTMSVGSSTPDAIASDNVLTRTLRVVPTTDVTTTIVGPASVMAGQTVSYAATFTNAGPDGAAYTAQTLQLPTGLSGVVITDQNGTTSTGGTYDPTTGLVTLPVITNYEVGAVQVFNVSFPAPAQNYTVSSAVSTTTTDTAPANNAATVATTVGPMADVAVAIVGPPTAVAGNPVTYTVTTSNNGPVAASSVATTLQLPANLSNVSTSGSYNSNTGLVTFNTIDPLPAGGSAVNYATFTMPSAASGTQSITGTAAVSTTSTDNVSSNNTAGITTSIAPATNDATNLAVTIPTAPAATVTAGSTLSYQFNFANTGSNPAASVVAQASLPTGLTAAGLTVAGSTGTLANGVITFGNGTTYSQATGLLNFPAVSSLAASGSNAYAVSFPAPGNGPVLVSATISSNTSETTLTDNQASTSSAITASYDAITSLNGPATALPGTSNVYEVTTANNGPSIAPSITQTVTLPANLTPATLQVAGRTGTLANGTITYTNAAGATIATYSTSSGVLTFAAISNLAPGAANAITNTFAVTMPASGSLALTANVTSSGESNTNNNSATYTTTVANRPPVTRNVVNSLQSARANNAVALPISPLSAVDSDGTVASYTITSAPNSGTLYNNGSVVTDGTVITDPTKLTYVPASGFIGNAFFSYTATDNNSATSAAPSLYTIPVASDQSSTYTATPQKGSGNAYQNNDVLTYIIDPNGAVYNNTGLVYNTNGTAATANGNLALANGVTSAALAANGPSGNTSNTLPAGVSLNLTTGQLFVSDRTKLRTGTYSVNITTTDANGGSNTLTETFSIGAYPLPVELVAFTAQAVQNRDGLLKWTTASELHNDHFELERSLDGTSFVKIGQVAGQGSKTSATDYTFTDAGIAAKVPASQPVYYRLKQVDQDGTSSYSPVRSLSFTGTVVATVTLYPNPAKLATGLDFSALPATGTYQVLLVDAAGRQVRQLTLAGGQVQPLDLHELASGTYSVLVTGQQADGSRLRQVLRLIKE